MRKYFFVFAICALAASPAISAAQRWNDETENVSRTLKLEPGGKLVLKSFSGRVTITGTDAAGRLAQPGFGFHSLRLAGLDPDVAFETRGARLNH